MITHVGAELIRLHDGLLDAAAEQRVRAHLADCARCRELDEEIAFSRGLLLQWPEAEPRPADVAAARAALRDAVSRPVRESRMRWGWVWAGGAAAAAAIAAFWFATPHVRFVPPASAPRSIERLVMAPAPIGQRTSSLNETVRFVRDHSGVRPRLKPGDPGRRIVGVTASPNAALIHYEIDRQPVLLAVARVNRTPDAPPSSIFAKRLEVRELPGERVFTWTASSHDVYSLTLPHGVRAERACAICHEGTRTLDYIRVAAADF